MTQQLKLVSSLGMMVVLTTGLAFAAGFMLNRWFQTGPVVTGLCVMAGAVLALIWASRRVSAVLQEWARQARREALAKLAAGNNASEGDIKYPADPAATLERADSGKDSQVAKLRCTDAEGLDVDNPQGDAMENRSGRP